MLGKAMGSTIRNSHRFLQAKVQSPNRHFIHLLWFLCLILGAERLPIRAQSPPKAPDGLRGKSLRIPKFDKTNRLESLLSIAEAEVQGEISHLKGVTWISFIPTNGPRLTNIVIQAPNAILNNPAQSISSAGHLSMILQTHKIQLQGEGFLLDQTNANITVSNNVSSAIALPQRSAPAQTPSQSTSSKNPSQYFIDSASFSFSALNRNAVYRSKVFLSDKVGFSLYAEYLEATISQSSNRLDNIRAQTNLIVQTVQQGYGFTNTLRGQKGVYTFAPDSAQDEVEISGKPAWSMPRASGNADLLRLKPNQNRFFATGNGRTVLEDPRNTVNNLRLPNPNSALTGKAADGQRVSIDIKFGSGEFRPGNIQLTDQVEAIQQNRLNLTCSTLIGLLNTENILQKLEGTGNVTIQLKQSEQTFKANAPRLEFWTTGLYSDQLALSGGATWSSQSFSGSGEIIHIDTQNRVFTATNRAKARIEFISPSGTARSLTPKHSPIPEVFQGLQFGGDWVDISAQYYQLKTGAAFFDGGVVVSNRDWILRTTQLAFVLDPESNRIREVVADNHVEFERFEIPPERRKQRPTGTNSKPEYFSSIADGDAPWKLTCAKLVLKVDGANNVVRSIEASQNVVLAQRDVRATGDRLVYDAPTEILRLSGSPIVSSPTKGEIRGSSSAILLFDIEKDTLKNEGNVDIRVPGSTVITKPLPTKTTPRQQTP